MNLAQLVSAKFLDLNKMTKIFMKISFSPICTCKKVLPLGRHVVTLQWGSLQLSALVPIEHIFQLFQILCAKPETFYYQLQREKSKKIILFPRTNFKASTLPLQSS